MNKLKILKKNRIFNLEKKLLDQDLKGYDHYVFIDDNHRAQLITNGKWVTEFIRTAVIKHNALICEVLNMREEDFSEQEWSEMGSKIERCSTLSSDSNSKRLQRENFSEMEREIWAKGSTRCLNPDWRSYVSKPILRRGDDGLSYRVDRTKALGNSVVPQVAVIPLKRVHDLYYNE